MSTWKRFSVVFLVGTFLSSFFFAHDAVAYSVLGHEAIVDAAWEEGVKPLLLRRFPDATPQDLRHARAYAYGGCLIQDLGYFPFGNRLFTDLVHYVRTGDFIISLINNSRGIDEYAFALGALSHYSGDAIGHSLGVNEAAPLIYPKYAIHGRPVTYADSRSTIKKIEFGFDVVEVAHGNYVSQDYHDYIGFKVSKDLLERAFEETYSLSMKHLFTSLDLALASYRKVASKLFPEAVKLAWRVKQSDIKRSSPAIREEQSINRLARSDYEDEWGPGHDRLGVGTKAASVLVRILPRFGFMKELSFKPPTPESARLLAQSFEASVQNYKSLLDELSDGKLSLENRNFDTGKLIKPGEYPICDTTYAKLLNRLHKRQYKNVSASLRENILAFYGNAGSMMAVKTSRNKLRKTIQQVNRLKQMDLAQAPA